jgi:hypothetical protein
LDEWCRSNKFVLDLISFRHNMWSIEIVYSINGTELERVDEIKDLGAILDERMPFLPHIEAILFSVFQESLKTCVL